MSRALCIVIVSARDPEEGPPAAERSRSASRESIPRAEETTSSDGAVLTGKWSAGPRMSPLTLNRAGKLIKKGSMLIFQMHYTTNGLAAKDRTSVGLVREGADREADEHQGHFYRSALPGHSCG